MNLSMKWLSDYVTIEDDPRSFSHKMTMSGSKVEGYQKEGSEFDHVIVGEILSVDKHPDADKLVVCKVNVGKEEPIQIVTAATNVFAGAKVPVAMDGAHLPGGVKIKKGKLRGVESNGMFCSIAELGVTVNDFPYAIEDGIFIIQEDCVPGDDVHAACGIDDISVEFEITSNRPDCLSVIGLAREAAATYDVPLRLKKPVVQGSGGDIGDYLSVTVENQQLCLRYMAKVVKNVKIAPSPRWMRERLRASGVRPINNLVDITNYVMLEYGQPMHAFDLNYVAGNQIVVRNAKAGERITTLDGTDHELSEDMLVICDAQKPAAVAGVMGGEYSGIMDDTHTVVFESACFHGASVRRTAKKLGLRTESSGRFEKGLDPHICEDALLRACELVELLGAGEVVDGMVDCFGSEKPPVRLKLEHDWINRFLDIDLSAEEMTRILKKLDFEVEGDEVIAPSFRIDIEHKADIAEEIARFYGYDKIPVTAIRGTAQGKLTEEQLFERKIHQTMLALGCSQINTYSFISPKYYDKIGLPADDPLRRSVVISNPLGEDTSVMRTTSLPSMMEILARNYNNRLPKAYLYELASEYIPTTEDQLPIEKKNVTIGLFGPEADYYVLKGMVETLLRQLNIGEPDIERYEEMPFHPGRSAKFIVDGVVVGLLGEVHPKVLDQYGIGVKCYLAKLDLTALLESVMPERTYQELPKFPATSRDISVVCDEEVQMLDVEKAIRKAVGKILEKVELFDVYRGEQVAKGKKSLSFAIRMRSYDHTLKDEEADGAMKKVLKALDAMGISLRS